MADGDEISTFKKFEPYLNRVKEISVFRELYGGNKIVLAVRGGSGKGKSGDLETSRDQFLVMWYDGPFGHAREFAGTVPDVSKEAGFCTPVASAGATRREKADGGVQSDPDQVFSDVYLCRMSKSGTFSGPAMSPEVYYRLWDALSDQDDFVFVLLEMPASRQVREPRPQMASDAGTT
ncbi:hypothetical protein [Paractinoplanes hotanensis]|uniref:Uncharacterized protein n=1 Tax=Paractinoplanes hotanensis TaxID=2906497 RepID=A0ABT0YE57_9ACTN|nr:hypothetical protein [Actinoplanes hotanensis]MCM4084329.1 hypothetical protein [Actinoplanes hotanensis]